jgi:hypothetical protein
VKSEIASRVRAPDEGRPQGDRASVVVRVRESRTHGEGGQAGGRHDREARDMRICCNGTTVAQGDGVLIAPLESRMSSKGSRPVRRGAAETGPHGNRADRPPYVLGVSKPAPALLSCPLFGFSRTFDENGLLRFEDGREFPGKRGPLCGLAPPDHRKCGRTRIAPKKHAIAGARLVAVGEMGHDRKLVAIQMRCSLSVL